MIGDVLVLKPVYESIARKVFNILKRNNGLSNNKIITIAGESGSGKSEIAHNLRIQLKNRQVKSKILHLDNYFVTSPDERTAVRQKLGVESVGEDEINWKLLNENIRSFKTNKKTRLPFLDLFTNQEDVLFTNFKGIDVLLIEGLYATRVPAHFRFFIDKTYHETRNNQKVRKKEKQTKFREKVLEREHLVIQSHRKMADYFITYSNENEENFISKVVPAK